MNILIAGFQHETNTFAPSLADWTAFCRGDSFPAYQRGLAMQNALAPVNIPIGGFIAAAQQRSWNLLPSLWAGAIPSSYVTEEAFERIASELCGDVRAAMHTGLDAIYLDLHGAAVAQHVPDTEGELIARLRALVGPQIPIVASLDLHANVTQRMLQLADALVSYRTYPHIDMAATGALAADLLERRLRRGQKEPLHYRRLPYLIPLNAQSTWIQPAQRIYGELAALDAQHGAVLSFCMGFPAADFDECAPMLWGYGEHAASALDALYASASPAAQWNPGVLDAPQAVARALALAAQSAQPIVIADTQDNPGAGGDSNTTGLLHELLRQGVGQRFPGRVALGLVYDPAAAQLAVAHFRSYEQNRQFAGESIDKLAIDSIANNTVKTAVKTAVIAANLAASSTPLPTPIPMSLPMSLPTPLPSPSLSPTQLPPPLPLSLGKAVATFTGQLSDPPLQANFTVRAVSDGICTLTGPMMTGLTVTLGPTACLEIDGILIVVTSGKKQMLDRQLFRMVGINPEAMRIIVVKSSNHFRADFTPLVAQPETDVIIAKAAGPMAADPADLPWKHLKVSPSLHGLPSLPSLPTPPNP